MKKQRFTSNPFTLKADVTTWCPQCFSEFSGTTCVTGEHTAAPGDFTVCIYCASVLRFTPQMDLELSSLMDIPTHSRLALAQVVKVVKMLIDVRAEHKT